MLIFNGSPRGEESNSYVMSNWFEYNKLYSLKYIKKHPNYLQEIKNHEKIVFIYPLYVDAMPGLVKEFLELIEDNVDLVKDKEFLFIIHCGFPEAVHLRTVEKYHTMLKDRFNLKRLDTILSPGSEGVRLMPDSMNKKRRLRLVSLVDEFRSGKELSKKTLNKLAGAEKLSTFKKVLYKVGNILGLTNMYWNSQLKKNNAYKKRYDRPYE